MIDTKTIEIGGFGYTVAQLPARRGMKLLGRMGRLFGPALAEVLGGAESLSQLNLAAVAPAARDIFERITDSELDALVNELLGSTQVTIDGRTGPLLPVFDAHFAGRYEDVFRVLWFAVEVNFGGFFGGLAGKLAQLGARLSPTAPSSTSGTSGPPGASS